jgi:iron complex outermembrane recepter protein
MTKLMTVRTTVAAILACCSFSAHAIADAPKQVNIPAGDLRQALLKLSAQLGTELVYRPEQVQGVQTAGARGELTTEQTILRLLEGTPLVLRTDPSGAMLITQVSTDSNRGRRAP